jgi:hypothetical protein
MTRAKLLTPKVLELAPVVALCREPGLVRMLKGEVRGDVERWRRGTRWLPGRATVFGSIVELLVTSDSRKIALAASTCRREDGDDRREKRD